MTRLIALLLILATIGCDAGGSRDNTPPPAPLNPAPYVPEPVKPKPPCPCPGPGPCPCPRPPRDDGLIGKASVGGDVSPDGTESLMVQLPGSHHQKNSVGTDGSGLCVFASLHHAGDWQSDQVFYGIFDYMKKFPGGGYPEKVDKMIAGYAKQLGVPVPKYVQVQDNNLDVLKVACRNGMLPGVTYSKSPTGRYGGQSISHMVNCAHASDKWFVVLDNNYIGDNQYEWMSPDEFLKTYSGGGGKGWCVVLLTEPPPPVPFNKAQKQ